jgi:iron complex outermembrane receptor protein
MRARTLILFFPLVIVAAIAGFAQDTASTAAIRGIVRLEPSGVVVRNAVVTISELRKSVLTNESGKFEFIGVPVGRYQFIAHLDRVPDTVKAVEVTPGNHTVNFALSLDALKEEVTVTASGNTEAVGSSYQPVNSVSSLELAQRSSISVGEALADQLGVAKRSFGPGSGRPVIRGFDGDRVLVLQDGLRVGGIASASADETEPLDVLSLDRVEVVKGPATLLYGSNAIGGVVNGVSANNVYQKGISGYLTTFGGTNNWQAGTSGGLKYGIGNFLFFGNGGDQKANDYSTPIGRVLNSYAQVGSGSVGAGWFPRNGWLSFTYIYDRRRHGLPVAPEELDREFYIERRNGYEARGGLRDLKGFIESGDFAVSYNSYRAREFEFESDENVTEFEGFATNKGLNYRAFLNHRRYGRLSGTLGFSGFTRDFVSVGAEAPAPRTRQNSFAVYDLERIDFRRVGFQFGGRVEQNGYRPEGNLPNRNFLGFSGSAAVRVSLWAGGSLVANYQHSFRAPALEELYNNGPHPGTLTFDIGNANLNTERSDGIDLSLRHNSERLRLESGFYYYDLRDFVFAAFTGQIDPASNLPIINYAQGRSRYVGTEASTATRISPALWLNAKLDYVWAELTELNKPLPRIPPLRATLGLDWSHKAFSIRPNVVLANRQTRVFDNETPTAGYATFNVSGSYTIATERVVHIISVTGNNLADRLYRNHLSFVKDVAPEIGRNMYLSYSLRF